MRKKYEKKLLSINWFSEIGNPDIDISEDFSIRFERTKTKSEMEKRIASQRWENKTLDEQGDITVYLQKNFKEQFKNWNLYAEEAREFIDKFLMKMWKELQCKNGLSDDFISSVRWDTIHFIIVSRFSEEVNGIPTFFLKLFEVYQSGHVPCGWSGKKDKGFIYIY